MNLRSFLKRSKSPTRDEKTADTLLLRALFILIALGLVFLYSVSSASSYNFYNTTTHFLNKQLGFLAIGLVFFFIILKIDYRFWKKWALPALIVSILVLLLVFIPGLQSDLGPRWLKIYGGFTIQPSEFVKLTYLLYLATWIEARREGIKDFLSGTLPFVITLGAIIILMFLQSDLGTLLIIGSSALAVFYLGGGRLKYLILLVLIAVVGLMALLHFRPNYQSDRIHCYKDPSYDPQDKCYQINQSLIAIGSGGWLGRGFGQSRQKFMYLPEISSDAIFPIIAEEIGFIFSSLFLLLYLFILYRGLLIAKKAPDLFGSMLATGIVIWFGVQIFLNIGGMTNLSPMTGVPLPFVSAGGTSLWSSLLAMGLLLNISKQIEENPRRARMANQRALRK